MRTRKWFSNGLYIQTFLLAIALLSGCADAHAWSGYPPRYPGYWQPPVAYQAVPVAYARPGYPAWGYPPGHFATPAVTDDGKAAATGEGESGARDTEEHSGTGRKSQFIAALLPVVSAENERLLETRQRLTELQQSVARGRILPQQQQNWLARLAADYRIDGELPPAELLERLLQRVDAIPAGLAIAQAANESAWGTSRFAREGNNLFGVWTWDEDKGVKPERRAAGKTHLVRVYDSQAESVRDYMLNLNSHPAYQPLRALRAQLRNREQPLSALRLAEGLEAYSELGDEYVRRIQSMIRANDLEQVASLQLATATQSE
jgi:Bax protein